MNFKHYAKGVAIALCLSFIARTGNSQTAKQVFSNTGIWQDYGTALSATAYPEFKGRLVNINWADIETTPDV